MKRGSSSQIVPVIIIVIIVVVAVAAIVTLARTLFGGNSGGSQPAESDQGQQALLDTSGEFGVRMTVRGDLTADEKFRSYQIIITPEKRSMATYSGYLDRPIKNKSLNNNTRAYEEFVHALDRAGYMKGKALEGDADDTRGLCADGKILEFETIQGDQTVKRLWTTTCKNAKGSFKADSGYISDLFLQQVPGGDELIKDIQIKKSPF